MTKVAGVALESFEGPIREALSTYSERTGGAVSFDIDTAAYLRPAPESKQYAASSTSQVTHLGEAAMLYVIAFAPGDGSGDGSGPTQLSAIEHFESYPSRIGSLPRSKATTHSEVHLTVASTAVDEPNSDPVLFAGSLDLVGLDTTGRKLTRLKVLGQHSSDFNQRMATGTPAVPTVTSTTGYKRGERFGDPHAAVNARLLRTVQIAGFIGLSPHEVSKHYDIMTLLGADIVPPTN